eukprot:TRINITY_DN3764_c0_g1_i2.p1 TRINITY_DN3764_c0_g1~~TRINITY_DN3764_c0_g1_i2.p1  ORF type:complete len:519 (-),score=136.40 TRINITY_DN3764_c0_g1_i2:239-1795(-)
MDHPQSEPVSHQQEPESSSATEAHDEQIVEREVKEKAPEDELSDEEFYEDEVKPSWSDLSALKKALNTQTSAQLADYFMPTPIEGPALDRILSMSPQNQARFRERPNDSGDFAHLLQDRKQRERDATKKRIANGLEIVAEDGDSPAPAPEGGTTIPPKPKRRVKRVSLSTYEGKGKKTPSLRQNTIQKSIGADAGKEALSGRKAQKTDSLQIGGWTKNDFDFGRNLGSGTFSNVYLAREKASGYIVVLKIIPKKTLKKFHAERSLRSELEIQSHLSHPNIVRLYGYFHDDANVYLILEFALYGDIFNDARLKVFDQKMAAQYVTQLCHALMYMHKCLCIHRDLKLENMYMNDKGVLKIGDLGWACHSQRDRGEKVVGTINYCAPEMLAEPEYNHKVDNWAVGVLLFEILTGQSPFFGTSEEIEDDIIDGNFSIPHSIPRLARDLIRKLLTADPSKRIELEDVLKHPFIVQNTKLLSLKETCLLSVERSRLRKDIEFNLKDLPKDIRKIINMYHFNLKK